MKKSSLFFTILVVGNYLFGQTFDLPSPQKTGGMPLMEALAKRSTARAFDTTEISKQQLSNLLWASFGVNRPDGKRTAPSANNKQEIDIYVLLKNGAYIYDAQNNKLILVTKEDLRSQAADQKFADAPVQLIFIADLAKRGGSSEEENMRTANIDCGYISQNTYLYCTSEGLATGARGTVKRDALITKLNLRPEQRILLAHSVGFPKK
jgi:SagB-type dehydrogenase family enzyme